METDNIMVSVFSNARAKDNPECFSLIDILENIKSASGEMKPIVEEIRKTEEHDKQNVIKLSFLPVFCPSGTFSKMEDKGIQKMSGVICIDIDSITDLKSEFNRIKGYGFVLSIFRSPSGNGLKVLVLHNLQDIGLHKELYWKIGCELGLTGRTDLKFDSACSNISHPCFWSYDSGLYLNKDAIPFNVDEDELKKTIIPSSSSKTTGTTSASVSVPSTISTLTDDADIRKTIKKSHILFEKYYNMYPGVRNQNLFKLACFFHESGVPEDIASDYLSAYYSDNSNSFPASEIRTIVKSAY